MAGRCGAIRGAVWRRCRIVMPVSVSRTRAALAVGATPNTGRPWRARSVTAACSMVVLPAPAGPTTSTNPIVTGDARCGLGLHQIQPAGGGSWWTVWVGRVGRRSPTTRCVLPGREPRCWCGDGRRVRSTPTDHPMCDAGCGSRSGPRSTQCSKIVSVARSSTAAHVRPSMPGCGRVVSQIACSTSRRCHAERRSVTSAMTSSITTRCRWAGCVMRCGTDAVAQ